MLLCMYYTCADICTHAGNEINEITRYEAADVKFKKINQSNHNQCGVLYKDVLLRMVVKQRCAMVDPSLGKSERVKFSSYELAIDTRRTKDEQIYYLCIASTYSS